MNKVKLKPIDYVLDRIANIKGGNLIALTPRGAVIVPRTILVYMKLGEDMLVNAIEEYYDTNIYLLSLFENSLDKMWYDIELIDQYDS